MGFQVLRMNNLLTATPVQKIPFFFFDFLEKSDFNGALKYLIQHQIRSDVFD